MLAYTFSVLRCMSVYVHVWGYIIGERERANLVVRLARFFYIYVYMYRPSGAHFTYAHAPNLLETPTRHVYPLRIRGHHGVLSRCGDRRRVGDTSVQRPTLKIHRKQRLPTDTAEETETRLGSCPSAVYTRISHTCIYNVYTFHVLL